MTPSFWIRRWRENKIGFHQQDINQHLQNFLAELQAPPGSPVLVPLCGKSLDMIWLRDQGYQVIGVELSPHAAEALFRENDIPFRTAPQGTLTVYKGDGIEILQGDFFAVRQHDVAGIRSCYDRAALIALPEEMRPRYAGHIARLLPSGARTLLITTEYPEEQMSGPPFSVREDEVRSLYQESFEVRTLLSADVLGENPRFAARGITELTEKVFILERH